MIVQPSYNSQNKFNYSGKVVENNCNNKNY